MNRTFGNRRYTRRPALVAYYIGGVQCRRSCFASIELRATPKRRRAARRRCPVPQKLQLRCVSIRPEELSLSLDDPGRTPHWSNQVGFYQILGDMRNARTWCLEPDCVLCEGNDSILQSEWYIRLSGRFCSGALNNCRHECDKCNLCSIQFKRDTVVNDNEIGEGRGAKANLMLYCCKNSYSRYVFSWKMIWGSFLL